ncbi:MAG: helicase-related protein, partial [bacterium]|nr:helicase-related protein [bacterium]
MALASAGLRAAAISGDVAQGEREKIVERLRRGALDVLVATDVAARGLDVERIGLVINFDVPREPEAYVHRIGRTGRAGRSGKALTFFTPKEFDRLRRIERTTGADLTEVQVPTPDDVANHRIAVALRQLPSGDLSRFEAAVRDSGMEPMHVAAALLAKVTDVGPSGPTTQGRLRREESVDERGAFIQAFFEGQGRGKDSRRGDRQGPGAGGKATRAGRAQRGQGNYPFKYRVEVGHRDGVNPGGIVGALTGDGRIDGNEIGRIDILPSFSLVELANEPTDDQMHRLQKTRVSGRALRMAPDSGPGGGQRGGHRGGNRGGGRYERRDNPRDSRNRW